MTHECPICRGGAVYRAGGVSLRTPADVAAYLECFDARYPPVQRRVNGLIRQMERMAGAL